MWASSGAGGPERIGRSESDGAIVIVVSPLVAGGRGDSPRPPAVASQHVPDKLLGGLLLVHPVHGGLSFRSRGEDRPLIAAKGDKPRGDVGGVIGPRLVADAERGTDESGSQLRDEFLDGVGFGAKA